MILGLDLSLTATGWATLAWSTACTLERDRNNKRLKRQAMKEAG